MYGRDNPHMEETTPVLMEKKTPLRKRQLLNGRDNLCLEETTFLWKNHPCMEEPTLVWKSHPYIEETTPAWKRQPPYERDNAGMEEKTTPV